MNYSVHESISAPADPDSFAAEISALMPRLLYGVVRGEINDLPQGALTLPQCAVLDFVHDHGPCGMQAIVRGLNLKPPHVTAIMDRLVSRRLARRVADPADRRRVQAGTTTRGKKAICEVRSRKAFMMKQLYAFLTPRERTVYLAVLRKLLAVIESGALGGFGESQS